MKRRKGITLIELVLTVALVGLVTQVVYSVFFAGTASYSVSTNKGFSQQDVRLVSDFLNRELKYISEFTDTQSDLANNYYSLKIEEIDGSNRLIKSHYEYDDKGNEDPADDELIVTPVNSLLGDWDSIFITNIVPDPTQPSVYDETKLGVNIYKSLDSFGFGKTSGSYNLDIEVSFLNTINNFREINVNLADGETLFYTKTQDTETKRNVLISSIPIEEEDDDDSTDTTRYSIQFVTNETSIPDYSIPGLMNETINISDLGVINGREFIGWYESPDFSGAKYLDTYKIKGNGSLYAQWGQIIDLNKPNDIIYVSNNNVFPPGNEGDVFSVGNNNGNTKVKLPIVYKVGSIFGVSKDLEITISGWTGSTSLMVTDDNQYIYILKETRFKIKI